MTAWDKVISRLVPASGPPAFLAHLRVCRSWANALIQEAATRGIKEDEIRKSIGRPASSAAKLVDEWLYRTVTGGVEPRRLAQRKVLVKRLVCVEDLGDIQLLLTDKTGTLTEGRITLRPLESSELYWLGTTKYFWPVAWRP